MIREVIKVGGKTGVGEYRTFDYLYKDEITAKVGFNYATKEVHVENLTDKIFMTPFGHRKDLNTDDLNEFFETRCVPRTRGNIDRFLEIYGLMYYNPYSIVQITHGVMMEDFHWIRFEGEEHLTFKDVRPDLDL